MSISQFMASGAAIAATATNEMLANNAQISESFFTLFENNTQATLAAASSQATNIQENIHDQAMNQKFSAIGQMVGGGLGSIAGLGGFAGATYYGSPAATENELNVSLESEDSFTTEEKSELLGDTEMEPLGSAGDDASAELEGSTKTDGSDDSDATEEARKTAQKQAQDNQDKSAAESTKQTSKPRNNLLANYCDRLAANAQLLSSATGSPFGLIAAGYTNDQSAPQAAQTIYAAVGQALNNNTGLVTTALQNRDSSTANVAQLMSTLIHASGGVAG